MAQLEENIDFYYNADGLVVLTEAYHLKRGHCCGSGCKHCPYNYDMVPEGEKQYYRRKRNAQNQQQNTDTKD